MKRQARGPRPLPFNPSWIVAPLVLVFVLTVVTAAARKSATYDESVHIYSGWRILTQGDFAINHEHPPLMKMLAALPLMPLDLKAPPTAVSREVDQWQAAHEFVYHVNDGDSVLAAARLPIALLAAAMALVLYRLVASWYGVRAGLVALALLVFEPNILAHSGLVTTDLGMTAMTLFTVGSFVTWLRTGAKRWLWSTGALLGLAFLTKFTAVLLGPVLAVLGAAWILLGENRGPHAGAAQRRGAAQRWKELVVALAVVVAVGTLVLNLVYGFSGTFSSLRDFTPESERFRTMAAGPFGGVPLPLPVEYVRGFDHAEASGQRWWAYLFGEYSMTGWRHYYLAAIAVKTPIQLLLLAIAGVLAATVLFARLPADGESIPRFHALLPLLVALVFLAAFTFSVNLKNIGLRYVLPVYPFLCMLGGLATRLRVPRIAAAWIVIPLLVWQAAIAAWIYPDFLTFFNLTVGGPARGAEVLLDSNLDWGQDLKGLGEFIRRRGIDRIYVDYFGRACRRYYGVTSTPDFEGGWIAVSATNLKGVYDQDKQRYRFLDGLTPEAVIGRSIFVYDAPRPADWRPRGGQTED